MTETGKSNYPVATPMGAQLTEEVVRDIAKLLETRGFPPFSDEDIGRLLQVGPMRTAWDEAEGEARGERGKRRVPPSQ
jgi:hypothetical protein